MKNEIIKIITDANYDAHVIELVGTNFNSTYKSTVYMPFAKEYDTNPLMYLSDVEKLNDSLIELIHLKDTYVLNSISLDIFYKTILDLNYRINKYYIKYGKYGIEASDLKWLGFMFRSEIFDLGSLRFQLFNLSYDEIERSGFESMKYPDEWKIKLPEGTPIINVHILSNANLSPVEVEKSFEIASSFFSNNFSYHKYDYYFCRSWMTYPKMSDLFDENSNIRNFINNFEVIASHSNPTQALNRIYNTADLNEIKMLEKSTRLQKKAYLNLDKLGVGLGIKKK